MRFLPKMKIRAVMKSPTLAVTLPSVPGQDMDARRKGALRDVVLDSTAVQLVFTGGGQLSQVFRHRYVLAHYVGLSAPVFAAFLLIGPGTERHTEHMPSVLVGIVAMVFAVALYVRAMRWLLRSRADEIRIPLTPGLLFGVAVLMAVSLAYTAALGILGEWSGFRLTLLFSLLWIYAEGGLR